MDADRKQHPEKGDWVQVWGQVAEIDAPGVHPEDVLVEFFSHSEQYRCHVRKDRVEAASELPAFVTACTALFLFAGGRNGLFVRCALHAQHGGKHQDSAGDTYDKAAVVGYMEEA